MYAYENGGGRYVPGVYDLHYRCQDCGGIFQVVKQRGPALCSLDFTYEEVLLLHALHATLLYAPHYHRDRTTGLGRLVGLQPRQNSKFYVLFKAEQ
jgi:hypothetical protein